MILTIKEVVSDKVKTFFFLIFLFYGIE